MLFKKLDYDDLQKVYLTFYENYYPDLGIVELRS